MIDSHQHAFWHGRDDAGLVADMDEQGIEMAWLLTWNIAPEEDQPETHQVLNPEHLRADGTHTGIPLSDLIRAHNRFPGRFVLGYCPHPCHGDAPGLFESAVRMHGVRVCGEWKFRLCLDDPRCLNLFHKAGQLGCPVVLHLDVPFLRHPNDDTLVYQPMWYGGTLDRLESALAACPNTTFIGHAPGFWRYLSGDADVDPDVYPRGAIKPGGRILRVLERYPNLFADLSANSALYALQRDPTFSHGMLEQFSDRFLFGRDYYGGRLIEFLRTLNLCPETWTAITRENAQRLVPPIATKVANG